MSHVPLLRAEPHIVSSIRHDGSATNRPLIETFTRPVEEGLRVLKTREQQLQREGTGSNAKSESLDDVCRCERTAVAVAGAAPAALAQQQDTTIVGERAVEERQRVSVPYNDLSLVIARDERTLSLRVKRAARYICQPNDDRRVYHPYSECMSIAWNNARPQIDLAVRHAREIASNGTSSIPLVAIAVVGAR